MRDLEAISQYEVFKNRKRILKNPLPFHHENFKKYGDIFKVRIGFRKAIVFTRDPVFIRHILQKQHKKYGKSTLQTQDLAKYIGHGILTSNGEHWRTHRRMVQPAFHKKKLAGLLEIMQRAIQTELLRIIPQTDQDIYPLMGDLAFQVVAKSLFSRSDIQERMQKLQEYTEKNQKMLIREMRQPYFKWWFHLSGQIRHHLALAEKGRTILGQLIEERLKTGQEKDDLLDMLLSARYEDGTSMSREQLIDEVLILFTAGHETTANALSFAFLLLAKHPEIQKKAFQEVAASQELESDQMAYISKMPFIKQCIEEALRLYPPAYIIDRVALEEDVIDGRVIPKNTLILMSLYELHRHNRFWDSPGDYRPERFDPEKNKILQEYYFPFGAGPRMCVGNNFAMYEMVLTVAEVLKKFSLHTGIESVEINPLISLKPKEVFINFTAREHFDH